MTAFPTSWTEGQRQRFAALKPLFGEGMVDAIPCIHVAGTNGKGSICAFSQAVLREAGYKTGLFTSPHLYRETERICVDGVPIPQDVLDASIRDAYQRKPDCKRFEAYFYAAVRWFAAQGVEMAVMETGIGGAMDATNILMPVLTATGTIGLDHVEILGHDIGVIARQKAGIAKQGVPMVLYPIQDAAGREAFLQTCASVGAPVCDLHDRAIQYAPTPAGYRIALPEIAVDTEIHMLGVHQVFNAATAAYMMHILGIPKEKIASGLEKARWPGRLEWISQSPPTLLDGAHNPEGARALRAAVTAYQKPVVLLTAMMRDKDVQGVVDILSPIAQKVVCTCADANRGVSAEALAKMYGAHAIACDYPKEAYRIAKEQCGQDGMIVVCGSLYLPSLIGWKETP